MQKFMKVLVMRVPSEKAKKEGKCDYDMTIAQGFGDKFLLTHEARALPTGTMMIIIDTDEEKMSYAQLVNIEPVLSEPKAGRFYIHFKDASPMDLYHDIKFSHGCEGHYATKILNLPISE